MIIEFEQTFMLVRELLNRHDIEGLSPGMLNGAPIDEYESEALIIAKLIFKEFLGNFDDDQVDKLDKEIQRIAERFLAGNLVPSREIANEIMYQLVFLMENRTNRQMKTCQCCFCKIEINPKLPGTELLVWRSIHAEKDVEKELWAHSDCLKQAVTIS